MLLKKLLSKRNLLNLVSKEHDFFRTLQKLKMKLFKNFHFSRRRHRQKADNAKPWSAVSEKPALPTP